MASVQENRAQFNPNLFISHTSSSLSSDSGLILIKELMNNLNFTQRIKEHVIFQDDRAYWQHDNHAVLEQLIFQLIAGYSADSSVNVLRQDSVFQSLLGEQPLASQSMISRFSVFYQAQSWAKPRSVCIRSTRPGGELPFNHEFIVTTLSQNVSSQDVFDLYAKRGTMENYIKE